MIEKEFLDRVPTYPGRVTLIPVSGQANTYDMARSDSPTVAGTPLDKATFDSVVQSRLTGRFYAPTVARSLLSTQTGIVANPIPASWTAVETTRHTSGAYIATASGVSGAAGIDRAFNGNTDDYWQSATATSAWLQLQLPSAIKVKKMRIAFGTTVSYSFTQTLYVQGSTDGKSWVNLYSTTANSLSLSEITLTTTGDYLYYRLYFDFSASGGTAGGRVYEWAFSEYDVNTYTNAFTVASGWPTSWTTGQRATIQTPSVINSLAVVSNTVNGITCNTILQPNKRYELRYTGSAFVAKEV